ncbi:hypothetical protein JHK87_039481 [Glycine soja]|nr:hypothetical protein JHK87_039481 [Glycine soja]
MDSNNLFSHYFSDDLDSSPTVPIAARSCSSSRIPASARFASSVATQQSSSGLGGLFGWLTGDRSSSLPSLDFPLLGVTLPPSLPNFVAPGKTIITTLPNGLKVASETSPLLKVKAEIGEASKNLQDLLLEAIHSAGFSGALANPLLASESALNRLNGTILEEFVTENYTAPRIVLATSGVEHEELLFAAEPLLSDLPSVPRLEEPKSVYTGGDYRCQSESGRTHFALAVELPGDWHKLKDVMVLTILGFDNVLHFLAFLHLKSPFLLLRCYWEVVDHSQLVDLPSSIEMDEVDFIAPTSQGRSVHVSDELLVKKLMRF